jgi:hypothetical protein
MRDYRFLMVKVQVNLAINFSLKIPGNDEGRGKVVGQDGLEPSTPAL